MQSEIINGIFDTVDAKIFQLVLQLIVVGAIVLYIKDLNSRIMNYYKLKMSDFGRGTKVNINGIEGFISHVRFNEVEIEVAEGRIALIPVEKFISSMKIIETRASRIKNESKG